MQRRQFLRRMLGIGIGLQLTAGTHAQPAREEAPATFLQECLIAGSAYYAFGLLLPYLHEGTHLELRAEPDNPHDHRAVEVFLGDKKLGYLPRSENAAAAVLLENGHHVYAEVVAVLDPDEVWEPLLMRVYARMRSQHESLS